MKVYGQEVEGKDTKKFGDGGHGDKEKFEGWEEVGEEVILLHTKTCSVLFSCISIIIILWVLIIAGCEV